MAEYGLILLISSLFFETLALMTPHNKGLLCAHLTAVLFGMTGILGALIQAHPLFITFGRAAFACLCLYFAALFYKTHLSQHLNRTQLLKLLFSGTMLAIHWLTFFIAVKEGGVAMATLGFASFPAFITILERFVLRDTVNLRSWLLVLVVMLGLFLVTPSLDLQNQNTGGLVWGIVSGFAFAALAVSNRTYGQDLDSVQIAFWQNLIVALLTLPFLLFIEIRMMASDWFWLAVLGSASTALSHFLFVTSLQYINARTAGLIIALEPVYAILVAWPLFNEVPTLKIIIGGLLIIGAAVFPNPKSQTH